MNFYRRRPFALAATVALVLLLCSSFLSLTAELILLGGCLVLFLLAALILPECHLPTVAGCPTASFFLICALVVLVLTSSQILGVSLAASETRPYEDKAPVGVSGYVTGAESSAGFETTYRVTLTSLNGKRVRLRGLVSSTATGLSPGDSFSGNISFSDPETFWGSVSRSRSEWLADGVSFTAEVSESEPLSLTGNVQTPDVFFSRLRARLSALFSVTADRETSALAKALLLADRSELGSLSRDFRRIGISHLLAVSGLHLTVLTTLLTGVLYLFHVRKSLRELAAILFAIGFCLIAGCPYSVLRATVMLTAARLTFFVRRDRDPITILFVTVTGILLFDPAALYDVGFAMSCAATLGVLLQAEEKPFVHLSGHRRFGKAIAVSAGAILFLLPIEWYRFGFFSLLALPATLLFTPIIELLLLLFFPMLLFAVCGWFGAASFIGKLTAPTVSLIGHFSKQLSENAPILSLRYQYVLPVFGLTFLIIVIMMLRGVTRKRFALIPLVGALILLTVGQAVMQKVQSDQTVLCYEAAATADALLYLSEGKALAVDLSDGSQTALLSALSAAEDLHHFEIDTLMLTHYHRRHTVMLKRFSERCLIRRLLLPAPEDENDLLFACDLEEFAGQNGIEIVYYRRGSPFTYGKTEIATLPYATVKRSTHPFVGISFTVKDVRLVCLGSSIEEAPGVSSLTDGADVLILSPHGPRGKSLPTLAEKPVFAFSPEGELPPAYASANGKELRILLDP